MYYVAKETSSKHKVCIEIIAKYECRIGGEKDECGRNAEKAAEHRLERARADVLFLQINRLRASRSKMRQDGCR